MKIISLSTSWILSEGDGVAHEGKLSRHLWGMKWVIGGCSRRGLLSIPKVEEPERQRHHHDRRQKWLSMHELQQDPHLCTTSNKQFFETKPNQKPIKMMSMSMSSLSSLFPTIYLTERPEK